MTACAGQTPDPAAVGSRQSATSSLNKAGTAHHGQLVVIMAGLSGAPPETTSQPASQSGLQACPAQPSQAAAGRLPFLYSAMAMSRLPRAAGGICCLLAGP
jgi:hypothetical protein